MYCCSAVNYRHSRHDDQCELPAMDKSVDEAGQKDGDEEDEHADLLADALL